LRYAPGENAEFDAQMRAIAALRPETKLAWLEERRRSMWELASERTRRLWVKQWLESAHHFTLEEHERARGAETRRSRSFGSA